MKHTPTELLLASVVRESALRKRLAAGADMSESEFDAQIAKAGNKYIDESIKELEDICAYIKQRQNGLADQG